MTPVAPRTVEQGESTRRRILDAAVIEFGRRGYRGCTLEEIAALAGVKRSTILHHFGSKENLLTQTLAELYLPGPDGPADPTRTLADAFDAIAEESARTPDRVRFFSVIGGESLTEDHPAHAFFRLRYDRLRREMRELVELEAGRTGAQLSGDDARVLANLAVAAMDGVQLQWLRNPGEVDMRAEMRVVTDLIRKRLRAAVSL